VRRRAVVAWALLALAVALGAVRTLTKASALDLPAGLCLLVAAGLGISLLPVWRRVLPSLAPLPGLFQAPRASERWCGRCGHPTARRGPCRTCGHTPASRAK